MTEETDNVVLRLLREIRGEVKDHSLKFEKMERQLSELRESQVTALGMAAHTLAVSDQRGERFDEFADEIAALKRRVAELEAKV